jgi:hypothetical protein
MRNVSWKNNSGGGAISGYEIRFPRAVYCRMQGGGGGQICKGILRYPNVGHERPMELFTESQLRS